MRSDLLRGDEDLLAFFGLHQADAYYATAALPVPLDGQMLRNWIPAAEPGDFARFGPDSRLGEALIHRPALPALRIEPLPEHAFAHAFAIRDLARAAPLGLVRVNSVGWVLGCSSRTRAVHFFAHSFSRNTVFYFVWILATCMLVQIAAVEVAKTLKRRTRDDDGAEDDPVACCIAFLAIKAIATVRRGASIRVVLDCICVCL